MCAAYGQYGHVIQEKTVLVGYACGIHNTSHQQGNTASVPGRGVLPDSGYGSRESRHSRRSRRWNVLSSITGPSWLSSSLVPFELEDWARYLFSFRRRTSSAPPSELTILFTGYVQELGMPIPASSAPWTRPAHSSPETILLLYIITLFLTWNRLWILPLSKTHKTDIQTRAHTRLFIIIISPLEAFAGIAGSIGYGIKKGFQHLESMALVRFHFYFGHSVAKHFIGVFAYPLFLFVSFTLTPFESCISMIFGFFGQGREAFFGGTWGLAVMAFVARKVYCILFSLFVVLSCSLSFKSHLYQVAWGSFRSLFQHLNILLSVLLSSFSLASKLSHLLYIVSFGSSNSFLGDVAQVLVDN